MKWIALLTALIFSVFTTTVPTRTDAESAEPADELYDLFGAVQEITEDHLLLLTPDGMEVQANLFSDTVYDGESFGVGDMVHVMYNGMMTRSLPGQIAAMRVSCWQLTGSVADMTEDGFLLNRPDVGDQVFVHADAALLENVQEGTEVTVYFNGIMTMSLPGQITAEGIVARE